MNHLRFFGLLCAATLVLPLYSQGTLNDGLIAYYPFSSNPLDSVGGHDGIVQGAILTEDRFGTANSAYFFDGVAGHISLPDHQATLPNFTLAAWIRIESLNLLDGAFAQVFRRPYLSIQRSTQKVAVFVYGVNDANGDGYYYSNNPVPLQEWVHICTSYEQVPGQYKVYIDGILDVSVSNKFGAAQIRMLGIGAEPGFGDGRYFHGSIDDIRLYGRTLTNEEVTTLASNRPTSLEQPLSAELFSIFPNPSSGTLRIESESHRIESLQLWDLQGREIALETAISGYQATLHTAFRGMAILRIRTAEGVLTRKLRFE